MQEEIVEERFFEMVAHEVDGMEALLEVPNWNGTPRKDAIRFFAPDQED
jgi:hypothetical protein